MKISCDINLRHLTRVEGHGNIRIRIESGAVREASWEVVETPRFFEAMLVGKKWENAPWICARICGICSIGHTLASIRAVENGFGFEPDTQTNRLRLLLKHMETLQSHILHLYFLVAPDFFGTGSILPLVETHPEEVQRAARLKLLANDACDLIGGRRLHPTRTVVGGFTMLPARDELRHLHHRLRAAITDLHRAGELFAGFSIPDFRRETEFVSLHGEKEYPFIGGDLKSSDGVRRKEWEYKEMSNEYCTPQSTAKWARLSRASFAVGALARLNNNFSLLHERARKLAELLQLEPVCHNPFMNNAAQLVECMHVVEDALLLIDRLLAEKPGEPRRKVRPAAGRGVGAVEVPRGILYHMYEFDEDGRIVRADCVIPTAQNHANIQHDIEALAREAAAAGMGDRDIEHFASMLVRSYDPCISCSVH
ncbi:MAG TPA: Ni/Fe hydrogenase subunit alpha [Desulfobacteraceae bacterium]|nr:Ni/Fe hydrogenase subunit alpha [Desulfobacteraceae bacterium]